MKKKPILFSTAMVQAILEGRKTQTRRIVKASPGQQAQWLTPTLLNRATITGLGKSHEADGYGDFGVQLGHPLGGPLGFVKCPYGKPEDVLWIRETWRKYYPTDANGYANFDTPIIEYAADKPEQKYLCDGDGFQMYNKDGTEKFVPWKPSIHMPKEACRLFLRITDIRVERLQDITEEDAIAEGAEPMHHRCGGFGYYESGGEIMECTCLSWNQGEYCIGFKLLWESINGPESWQANPWVWVVSFERTEKPE